MSVIQYVTYNIFFENFKTLKVEIKILALGLMKFKPNQVCKSRLQLTHDSSQFKVGFTSATSIWCGTLGDLPWLHAQLISRNFVYHTLAYVQGESKHLNCTEMAQLLSLA